MKISSTRKNPIRLVMCGYTPYLVRLAEILRENDYEVLSIVLPDNRHSDFMQQTLEGLNSLRVSYVYQPSAASFGQMISSLRPDMLFCFSHTRKIPGSVLGIEGVRKLNCHLGLLPEYRCLNPVNRAILNGESQAGFTIHELVEEMDAGDIFYREAVPIGRDETVLDVTLKLVERLSGCLPSVLWDIHSGRLKSKLQDPSRARYYPPIDYDQEGLIDWNAPGEEILRKIRALAPPWPGAFFYLDGKKIVVEKARFLSGGKVNHRPQKNQGAIIKKACKDGEIIIEAYHSTE